MLRSRPLRSGLLCLLLLGTSCKRDGGAPQEDVVTITFWHSFISTTRPALQHLIERFHAEHPGIRINEQYIPTGDALVQKLVTSIQSETAPDVSWIHADFLDKLVQSRSIYGMRHFTDGPDGLSAEEMADFLPGLLQNASWRDTLYALPMEATSLGIVYNKDHFREAGLDPERPPRTWDELHEYARALTADQNGDGKTDRFGFFVPHYPASGALSIWMTLQWTPFLWQAGGELIDTAQTRVLFHDEPGVRALAFWKTLYDLTDSRMFTLTHDVGFAGGRLSMVLDGPWDLPRYRELKDLDWGVAPLPAGPAGQATYLAGEHLVIFRQSRHPEAAWTFVKWVTRPDVQAMFSMESGYLPVRRSTVDRPEYQAHLAGDPGLRGFVEILPIARTRLPIDYHHVEINQYLAEAIERALVGGMDPKAALDQAAARSNRLLQGGG